MVEIKRPIVVADFLSFLIERVGDFLDQDKIFGIVAKENFEKGLFGLKRKVSIKAPLLTDENVIKEKVGALLSLLTHFLGLEVVEKYLEEIYTRIERRHTPLLANQIILPLIPADFLGKYRLSVLSKEELEALVFEKTKANEELKELDKRKTEFISVVAHQLRTPLSGLKWGLDLLVKGSYGTVSEEQKSFFVKAYQEIEHMIRLVENMLSANKIEFNAYRLTLTPGDLIAVLKEAIAINQEGAAERKVSLFLAPTTQALPTFPFDQERMLDVFDNLIDNAVRYAKVGGQVEIKAWYEEGEISCIIKDDGIGIPLAEQKEIFNRFYRAKNARATDPNGNGLGLYIAKSLIEMQGGTIRFESQENQGTTFFINFKIDSI